MVSPWQSWRHPGLQQTMSSYDKVVKLACKPKAAPPKSKVTFALSPWQCFSSNIVPVYWPYYSCYLVRGRRHPRCMQSLISSHSRAQYHCALYWIIHRALSQPVLQIVFKALIVLHMMIRNGSTDNVLSYLSSSEVLRLRDISHGNWEGQLQSILTFNDICLKVMIIVS
jgi:phosphatidylinositol-binding clathrin assembly protein